MNNTKLVNKYLIYEDNHLLVINKQQGVLVQGDKTGDLSLLDILISISLILYVLHY